jgi:hypothetical protein
VLGFDVLLGPHGLERQRGHAGAVAADVLGPGFRRLRQAHLAGANGAGVELFEFDACRVAAESVRVDYTRPGPWHICIVDRDVAGTVQAIARTGGRQRGRRIWRLFPGEPYEMAYCEDPFGNVIEVYSHPYEQIYANRRPDGAVGGIASA